MHLSDPPPRASIASRDHAHYSRLTISAIPDELTRPSQDDPLLLTGQSRPPPLSVDCPALFLRLARHPPFTHNEAIVAANKGRPSLTCDCAFLPACVAHHSVFVTSRTLCDDPPLALDSPVSIAGPCCICWSDIRSLTSSNLTTTSFTRNAAETAASINRDTTIPPRGRSNNLFHAHMWLQRV